MILKVDFSKQHFQLLFSELYNRVLSFAVECGDNEELIKARFASLIVGDERVNLLVNFNEQAKITGHCLYTLQPPLAQLEYIKVDSGHDTDFFKDCLSIIESHEEIHRITLGCNENKYKAYKKKYNFSPFKMLMYKDIVRQ